MAKVTIPTASYVGRYSINKENSLLPQRLPLAADFNQQCKLWRFYCTCLDLGCSNYRLEDFEGKNMSIKDRYLYWVKNWKMHYNDISDLIRAYKRARSRTWFDHDYQKLYRFKLAQHYLTKNKLKPDQVVGDDVLWYQHCQIVRENLEKLKMSAQHLLNARFTAKLAAEALRVKNKNNGIIA